MQTKTRIPPWVRRRLPSEKAYFETRSVLAENRLNTICEDAKCPNVWECWSLKTATFLILGDMCTRRCGFCSVQKGKPGLPDPAEPGRVARAVQQLGLRYVVVTSVDRDDLPDQGAGQFRKTIDAVRSARPGTRVEVLTPDFRGEAECLDIVFGDAAPEVFAHNIETVPRLYETARRGSEYARSLKLLRMAKERSGVPTKSGIMVGLGEEEDEVLSTLWDLRCSGVDILTIGQYLKPSKHSLNVVQFHPPEYFVSLAAGAKKMGFASVQSGPLVRSSYHAAEAAELSDEMS